MSDSFMKALEDESTETLHSRSRGATAIYNMLLLHQTSADKVNKLFTSSLTESTDSKGSFTASNSVNGCDVYVIRRPTAGTTADVVRDLTSKMSGGERRSEAVIVSKQNITNIDDLLEFLNVTRVDDNLVI